MIIATTPTVDLRPGTYAVGEGNALLAADASAEFAARVPRSDGGVFLADYEGIYSMLMVPVSGMAVQHG